MKVLTNQNSFKAIQTYLRAAAIAITALFVAGSAHAQVLNEVQQSLEQYRRNGVQEKIYTHTDKYQYLAGEILWLKVYAVNAANNTMLDLSKVAYVDLIDNDHNALLQAKVELKNAAGSASIYIPVNANSGNYKLRVYTSWMKNFDPGYYFEKNITIVNSLKSVAAVKAPVDDYAIQFFPEGGNLVKNIAGKVAFKATGRNGKGVDFKGAIVDQRNDTIVRFAPLKFGMGNFIFTPLANSTYRAVLTPAGSKQITKPLPAVSDEGYTMQVSPGNGSYNIMVKGSAANASAMVYMLVHTRQATKYAESKMLENGATSFVIDKSKLDDGISSITVFNSNKQPVCERLVFKYPSKKLLINATADAAQYNTRKKVNINLSSTDQDKKPAAGNLSMAVYKMDSLQTVDESDILSYLWLSSDLKGSIESAGYYLKNTDNTATQALDNLLLTQGWRRFIWNDVLTKPKPAYTYLPEYYGHLISGTLKRNGTVVAKPGVTGYLAIPGKSVQLFTAASDSTGRLLFDTKGIYGPNELVVQTNYATADSAYRIDIESPYSTQYAGGSLPAFELKPNVRAGLQSQSVAMQVQNLYNGDKANNFYADMVKDTTAFYGQPDKSYLLDNYVRFPTMYEVLTEYVTWALTSKKDGKYQLRMFNEDNVIKDAPLAMLDGVPIFDIDKVYSIDPLKVRKLDVIHNRYFYGPATMSGLLNFTTYKGNLGGFELDPKALVIDYDGLNQQREFYSPVYETPQQAGSRIADFRNLLYWAPNVFTHTDGSDSLSFYTSDQQGKYVGIIEGITADGKAGSQSFTFEVKK